VFQNIVRTGYPLILCSVDRAARDAISAILSGYELRFAETAFDFFDVSQRQTFDLVLIGCHELKDPGSMTCRLFRVHNETTPILLISDASKLSDEDAHSIGAQGVICIQAADFADELKLRVDELIDGENGLKRNATN